MPKGPRGEWRPPETGACAVHVMRIATGQIQETNEPPETSPEVRARASAAGKARAAKLAPERRRELAKSAADARWAR